MLCHSGTTLADPTATQAAPAPSGEPPAASTGSFFSSLKQAFRQDLNYEVVRGHFDVGSAPNTHRFYCLVDIRSGRKEEYGVGGDTFVRPDGMTGLKAGGVAPDSCDKAEQQGILVTSGYVVKLGPKASNAATGTSAPSVPAAATPAPAVTSASAAALTPAAAAGPPTAASAPVAASAARTGAASDKVDVAGIRLGMTPDQVRTVLKSKGLADYYESAGTLGAIGNRYLNAISAWSNGDDPESFEVLFTPAPGRERVMAIVHSAAVAGAGGTALPAALVRKYGGYSASDLPESPTWRIQSDGTVQTGDSCNRRAVVGGLAKAEPSAVPRQNLALKTTPDEFRYQIDRCGVAIITEDQATSTSTGGGAITRFTVTAYSPSIGFEGAAAATQLMQSAGTGSARPSSIDSKL